MNRIIVRLADGPDLVCYPAPGHPPTTIAELKLWVRQQRSDLRSPADCELRIIYRGRILGSSVELGPLASTAPPQQRKRRASGASSSNSSSELLLPLEKANEPENPVEPLVLHCAVSMRTPEQRAAFLRGSDESVADDAAGGGAPQMQPRSGFDQLLDVGLSAEDVSRLRLQFHTLRGTAHLDNADAIDAEERWMDSRGGSGAADGADDGGSSDGSDSGSDAGANRPPPNAPAHPPGADMLDPDADLTGGRYHLLGGVLAGFFGGPLVAACFLEPNLFSRKAQLGMFTGFIVNFIWGLVRFVF